MCDMDTEKMKKELRSAMKNQKTYSKAMEKALDGAADAMLFANKLASELKDVNGLFDDRDGNNPNVQKAYLWLKVSEHSLRWLKELHLTPDSVGADSTSDDVDELKKIVRNARKK